MKTGTGPASTLRCGVFVATADRMPEVHAMWHGHNWRRCRLLCLLPKTENQSYARRHYAWNCYQLSCDARIGAGGPRAVVAVPRWRATHRRGRAAMEGHAPSWPCRDGGPRTVVAVPRWRATLRRGRAAMEGHAPSWPCRDGGPRTVVAVPRWRATLRRGRAAAADFNKE
jgi:hypothetical protein